MLKWFSLLILCCVFLTGAVTAQAAVTTYTDQSSWAAAAGSSSVETFESATVENWTGATTFSKSLTDFTIAGTLPDSNDNAGVYSSGDASLSSGNFFGWSGNATSATLEGGPSFTITFSSARKAVAFDWGNNDYSDYYSVKIDGVAYTNPPFIPKATSSSPLKTGFWGIVSDTEFTSITFTVAATGGTIEQMSIDNVRYGAAQGGGSGSSVPFPVWGICFLAAAFVSVRLLVAKKQ